MPKFVPPLDKTTPPDMFTDIPDVLKINHVATVVAPSSQEILQFEKNVDKVIALDAGGRLKEFSKPLWTTKYITQHWRHIMSMEASKRDDFVYQIAWCWDGWSQGFIRQVWQDLGSMPAVDMSILDYLPGVCDQFSPELIDDILGGGYRSDAFIENICVNFRPMSTQERDAIGEVFEKHDISHSKQGTIFGPENDMFCECMSALMQAYPRLVSLIDKNIYTKTTLIKQTGIFHLTINRSSYVNDRGIVKILKVKLIQSHATIHALYTLVHRNGAWNDLYYIYDPSEKMPITGEESKKEQLEKYDDLFVDILREIAYS